MVEREPKKNDAPARAAELERLALAHGKKPVKSLKDLARGTPEDADELLAAIQALREDEA